MEENIRLAPLTTLGIGGPARWLLTADRPDDVPAAVEFARQRELPLFVLGGGSNLLVKDEGFPGVVLRMAIPGLERNGEEVRGGAGESWDGLVDFTVDASLAGMECLAGIPGTVGGTPIQNVGAYGQEVAETIEAVECFDGKLGRFTTLGRAECGFAYRTSLLNTTVRNRYIVTAVRFRMRADGSPSLKYADLRRHFGEGASPGVREVADAVRTIRRGKGMVVDAADPDSRSAGSFFRNPVVPEILLGRAAKACGIAPDAVPHWPAGNGTVKLPAAWLLERAGFVRGYAMGRAGISSKHTLALINRGGASAADVIALRERIIETVGTVFGITLEQEPVSLG